MYNKQPDHVQLQTVKHIVAIIFMCDLCRWNVLSTLKIFEDK